MIPPRDIRLGKCLQAALLCARAAGIGGLGLMATAVDVLAQTRSGVAGYEYISPAPGSQRVSPWNNIVIRPGQTMDAHSLPPAPIVAGAISGRHEGTWVLADDARTVVFKPNQPFERGERVQVEFGSVAETARGPLRFSFLVSGVDPRQQPRLTLDQLLPDSFNGPPGEPRPASERALSGTDPCDALPADLPQPQVTFSNNPEPGYMFIVPFARPFAGVPGHLIIVDNSGELMFYRKMPPSGAIDFKVQPSGLLTYFDRRVARHMIMDASLTVIDSLETGNGYVTDLHDLQWMPNGHWLLMSYDPQPVRMDSVVAGGSPNATVVGLIIQELDTAKNVVFQWRSWDHIPILDTVINPVITPLDYIHGNAIELDDDGHILVSSRNLHEITKINRQTGDIIWRLGRNAKQNEFTFTNDTRGAFYQHDIRQLPNGHLTMYDNGNGTTAPYSRAVEYSVDPVAKTVTQVWEYRHSPDVFSTVIGNVQRRASGGTMIDWGLLTDNIRVTDLHPDDSIALELTLPNDVISYRAFRFPWRSTRFSAAEQLDFGGVAVGRSSTRPLIITNTHTAPVMITCITGADSTFTVNATLPVTLQPGTELAASVTFAPGALLEYARTLYVRSVENSELVALDVALTGSGVDGLDGAPLRFAAVAPNPFSQSANLMFDLSADARVTLQIFDLTGRVVETLVDDLLRAGRHQRTWQATGREPGAYWARLRTGEFHDARRLLLVK